MNPDHSLEREPGLSYVDRETSHNLDRAVGKFTSLKQFEARQRI
jgi:hypothetical protein